MCVIFYLEPLYSRIKTLQLASFLGWMGQNRQKAMRTSTWMCQTYAQIGRKMTSPLLGWGNSNSKSRYRHAHFVEVFQCPASIYNAFRFAVKAFAFIRSSSWTLLIQLWNCLFMFILPNKCFHTFSHPFDFLKRLMPWHFRRRNWLSTRPKEKKLRKSQRKSQRLRRRKIFDSTFWTQNVGVL